MANYKISKRSDTADWKEYFLVLTPMMCREAIIWLRENINGEYWHVTYAMNTNERALEVRIKEITDCISFKLTWADYER